MVQFGFGGEVCPVYRYGLKATARSGSDGATSGRLRDERVPRGKGSSAASEEVCPVHRYGLTSRIAVGVRGEVCPVHRYGRLHLVGSEASPRAKYVRFIGT